MPIYAKIYPVRRVVHKEGKSYSYKYYRVYIDIPKYWVKKGLVGYRIKYGEDMKIELEPIFSVLKSEDVELAQETE